MAGEGNSLPGVPTPRFRRPYQLSVPCRGLHFSEVAIHPVAAAVVLLLALVEEEDVP